ncbi:MAG: response regulator [Chloroflexi bacterium]|nr:MAG: response regulator [Chloroflexota bacterium]
MPDPQPRVLVIDDDVPTVELLAELLADEGYAVTTAHDVNGGLAANESDPADVIILDLLLADQNGTVFVEQYRASGGGAPIVVLSAARDAPRQAAAIGSALVPKPFDVRDLLETVRRAVERSR